MTGPFEATRQTAERRGQRMAARLGLYGIAAIAVAFAIGYAAASASALLSAVYDPVVALLLVAAGFALLTLAILAVHRAVQAQMKRTLKRNVAARGAAVVPALLPPRVAQAISLPAAILAALAYVRQSGSPDDTD